MERLFVSHCNQQNPILHSYGSASVVIILSIIFLLIMAFTRNKRPQEANRDVSNVGYIGLGTAKTLRGFAIIFLILGHFTDQCIEGVLPFQNAGEWAVIIFLFISGIGLSKKYPTKELTKGFLEKRIRRLIFPVWMTAIFFYLLDYLLLDNKYPAQKIILHFFGIISSGPPNGVDWFISYILFFYGVFYIVSLLNISSFSKSTIILFCSYFAVFCLFKLFPFLNPKLGQWEYLPRYTNNWIGYSIVFPLATLIGFHERKVFSCLTSAYRFSRPMYIMFLLSLLLLYQYNPGISLLVKLIPSRVFLGQLLDSLAPFYFVAFLTMSAYLLELIKVESGLLSFLGRYSLGIYLLHLPFLIYYDFFLFRKPLALYFFVYGLLIIVLSYLLKSASGFLNKLIFQRRVLRPGDRTVGVIAG